MENKDFIKLKASFITDLFQNFCELHQDLYGLTCDEYHFLLESDLDKLETAVSTKQQLINDIAKLEEVRQESIKELELKVDEDLSSTTLLLEFLDNNECAVFSKRLTGLRAVLKDMIEKIQEQNKRNQVFLNKALHSLSDLKNSFKGEKTYNTYNKKGLSNARSQRG